MNDRQRGRAVTALKRYLLRTSLPRVQMTLIVLVTGAAGFLLSFGLLKLGMTAMMIRYPLAVAGAYAVFLGLIRLWAEFQRLQFDESQVPEPTDDEETPRGGDLNRDGRSILDYLDLPTDIGLFDDAEGGCLLVIPLLLVGGAVVAVFSVVAAAPALFAEVLLDAVVVAALYRRLRNLQRQHWLAGAVRRTWFPALIAAALLAVAGTIMQGTAPEVRTIGGFVEHVRSGKSKE